MGSAWVTPTRTVDGLNLISRSAAQTRRIGQQLGRLLQSGDVVCLEGDLGTGKTCLTQGIARGLGVVLAVASPTFIIINEYMLRGEAHKLRHIDLYRVESIAEARALGLEDYFYDGGVCVIEWAERAREILPDERLWVSLCYVSSVRRALRFDAQGRRYEQLLERLRADTLER